MVAAITDQAVVDVHASLLGELPGGQARHQEGVLDRLPDVVADDGRVAGLTQVLQRCGGEGHHGGGRAVDLRFPDAGRGSALNRLANRRGALPVAIRTGEQSPRKCLADFAREGVTSTAGICRAFAVHIRAVRIIGVRAIRRVSVEDGLAHRGVRELSVGLAAQAELLVGVGEAIQCVTFCARVRHLFGKDELEAVLGGVGNTCEQDLRRRPALHRKASWRLLKLAGIEARNLELLRSIGHHVECVALLTVEVADVLVDTRALFAPQPVRVLTALGTLATPHGLARLHLVELGGVQALHILLRVARIRDVQGVADVARVGDGVRVEHADLGVLRKPQGRRLSALNWRAIGRTLQAAPHVVEPVPPLDALEVIGQEMVPLLALDLAQRLLHGVQWALDGVLAGHLNVLVVRAVEGFGVLDQARGLLARHRGQVVAVVHLIDVLQPLAAATHLSRVALTDLVAHLVRVVLVVVEVGGAVALVPAFQSEELSSTDILAEVPANLDSHGLAIHLLHEVFVSPSVLHLHIMLAADVPISSDTTFRIDVEWRIERFHFRHLHEVIIAVHVPAHAQASLHKR
mmetsp:Transcript_74553/g.242036  ORF Transcript_74553/g.242036 Transcript_74553/m.242036 type:complete len:575 (+) Transcript_74553:714-2438(+)